MRILQRVLSRTMLLLAMGFASTAAADHDPRATPSVHDAPYAGCMNYACQAPAFRWGWFGVEDHRDPQRWHRSYYGYPVGWQTYRRY